MNFPFGKSEQFLILCHIYSVYSLYVKFYQESRQVLQPYSPVSEKKTSLWPGRISKPCTQVVQGKISLLPYAII